MKRTISHSPICAWLGKLRQGRVRTVPERRVRELREATTSPDGAWVLSRSLAKVSGGFGCSHGPGGLLTALLCCPVPQVVQLGPAAAPEPPLPQRAAPPRAAGDGAEGCHDGEEPGRPLPARRCCTSPPQHPVLIASSVPTARRAAGLPLHAQIPAGRAAALLPLLLPRPGGAQGDSGQLELQPSPPVRHGEAFISPARGCFPAQGE